MGGQTAHETSQHEHKCFSIKMIGLLSMGLYNLEGRKLKHRSLLKFGTWPSQVETMSEHKDEKV